MLPHHIGYLKLNGVPDASVCRSITDAAMQKMDNTAALILDLRDNPGGFGSTALQIAAFLFDRPTYLYDPRANTPHSSTTTPVAANRLSDKPLYVLTS